MADKGRVNDLLNARQPFEEQSTDDGRQGRSIQDEEMRDSKNDQENLMKASSMNEVQRLKDCENRLLAEIHELREQNELLEFRLLEVEYYQHGSASKSERATSVEVKPSEPERDENSDSGILSLSPYEDLFTFTETDTLDATKLDDDEDELRVTGCTEVQRKLSRLFQYVDNTWDKVALQRAIDLIRHYEMRIIGMGTTLTNICQEERIQEYSEGISTAGFTNSQDYLKSKSQSPFTNATKVEPRINESFDEKLLFDADRLQESGIFDEFSEYELVERKFSSETRTDSSNLILARPSSIDSTTSSSCSGCSNNGSSSSSSSSSSSNSSGCCSETSSGLADELSKLDKIKQRIEERGPLFGSTTTDINAKNCVRKVPIVMLSKELAYFKKQCDALKNRLAAFESSGDIKIKQLADKLQKENELQKRVEFLTEKMVEMEKEMRRLEEEKCEYEEAENDTRLRSQKLEVKLYALAEKKNDLQFQLQHHIRTVSTLRNTVSELEKERDDAFRKTYEMEMLVNEYEERNFELEEREMDVRYSLQMLEAAFPVLLFWNLFVVFERYSKQHSTVPKNTTNAVVAPPLSVHTSLSVPTVSAAVGPFCTISDNDESSTRTVQLENRVLLRSSEKNSEDGDDAIADESRSHFQDDDDFDDDDDEVERCWPEVARTLPATAVGRHRRRPCLRDEVYMQTLQQADEIIVAIENDFKRKLDEMQRALTDKHWKLEECERKLSMVSSSRAMENHLLEKTQNLEADITSLKQMLRARDKEKQLLAQKEKRLTEELDQLNAYLAECKSDAQEIGRRLENERAVSRERKKELDLKEQEMREFDQRTDHRIKLLERKIATLTRETENQEVTNGELKEEVETLENTVCDLNLRLSHEMNDKEKMRIKFCQELALKQQEVDSLQRLLQDLNAISAAQEINLWQNDEANKAASPFSNKYCDNALPRILSSSKEYELKSDTKINVGAANKVRLSMEKLTRSKNGSSAHIIRHKHRYTILLRPLSSENFSHFEVTVNNHRLPATYECSQMMMENGVQNDTISLTIKPKGL